MTIDLAQFLPSFLEESYEGIEVMESGLLNLQPGDLDAINAIFRAAHSIKGGAGTFGFDQVTKFTHLVETLLDEMRDGRRDISQSDIEILLESVDCIRLLIDADKEQVPCTDPKITETSQLLTDTLNETSPAPINEEPEAITDDEVSWQIEFIPEHHLVKTGNDPIFLFNALNELGKTTIVCHNDHIPDLHDIDAEELYLYWSITLVTSASEADIREVFEWVEDECQLTISKLTPESKEQAPAAEQAPAEVAEPFQPPVIQASSDDALTTATVTTVNETKVEKTAKTKPVAGSIRVGVDKVDSLINLVGELVITQSMLSELGNDFELAKIERLTSGLEQLLQNTKELQESVMRIRMLPISFAFNRFPRLIHDLSKKTGKDIELIIKGEQTELDKTVMEQIGDPLVHLVRNAVDHGIEPAEQRIANGKDAKGTIYLDAYHQGGNIVIEIRDDGGGIDRQAVFDKALEKGLVDENSSLTDSQVFDLIFEPGFSTAKTLSDISGRGVGMDVVKRNIQSLGGRIQVQSEPNKGSTFKVHLPLTLAILDGQLVKVGSETYIIPLISIVESLQAKSKLINRVSGDMVLYRLRKTMSPFYLFINYLI